MRFLILLLAIGLCACNEAKIAQLEKENNDLRKQVADSKRVDLATQEKCSSAAQRYFEREFPPDKDTFVLTQQNHYNQARGKCYIFVERHYYVNSSKSDLWIGSLSLMDVFENDEVALFSQFTQKGTAWSDPTCEVAGKKCESIDEFNRAIHPFMSE